MLCVHDFRVMRLRGLVQSGSGLPWQTQTSAAPGPAWIASLCSCTSALATSDSVAAGTADADAAAADASAADAVAANAAAADTSKI